MERMCGIIEFGGKEELKCKTNYISPLTAIFLAPKSQTLFFFFTNSPSKALFRAVGVLNTIILHLAPPMPLRAIGTLNSWLGSVGLLSGFHCLRSSCWAGSGFAEQTLAYSRARSWLMGVDWVPGWCLARVWNKIDRSICKWLPLTQRGHSSQKE